ncbi:MAG: hypothetical protein ACXADC_09565 [Candidatus Thorarchaeota archaeon]|jgi:hypothetical protein
MLSIVWTDPLVILSLQVIAGLGFLFLGIYTLFSYSRMKSRTLLLMGMAFLVVAASIIMKITVIPQAAAIGIEKEYLEAIVEGVQLIAGALFFFGLQGIGRGATQEVA